jgi:hypothetical protein
MGRVSLKIRLIFVISIIIISIGSNTVQGDNNANPNQQHECDTEQWVRPASIPLLYRRKMELQVFEVRLEQELERRLINVEKKIKEHIIIEQVPIPRKEHHILILIKQQ